MKKTTWIVAGVAALLPLVGSANIFLTAPAEDGATAYLYNPDNGASYTTATFSGGQATLSTAGLSDFDKYAVTMNYASGQTWRSDLYWDAGGGNVAGYKTWTTGDPDQNVTMLSGAVTSRSFTSAAGSRSMSITMAGSSPLTVFNNDNNALDANILVYRPAANATEINAVTSVEKSWDSSTLGGGYAYSAVASGIGSYFAIEVTKDGGFYADYLGLDLGGGVYELSFAAAVDPGGSSFDTGFISDNGDGSVTFTSDAFSSVDPLADQTPYYLMMEAAWMYDDNSNYSIIPDDAGLALTNPDYYVIPEPAVLMLLLGGGTVLLGVRRVFMI